MRLLLDEHLSPEIARSLRSAGYDVVAAEERPELRGLADAALLGAATADRRAIVTENARDFVPLSARRLPGGRAHHGIVLMSPVAFPRARATIGITVRALAHLLDAHPSDDSLVGHVSWLQAVTGGHDAP